MICYLSKAGFRFSLSLFLCLFSLNLTAQDNRMDRLFDDVESAASKQRWGDVAVLAQQFIDNCPPDTKTFRLSKMLAYQAAQAYRDRDYHKALQLGQQVVEMRRVALNCEWRHIGTALNEVAIYHSRLGNYGEAIANGEEAVELIGIRTYKNDSQYAIAMTNLASFLCSRGNNEDYVRAAALNEKALDALRKNTEEYLTTLNNLSVCYSLINRLSDAQDVSKKAMKLGKKLYEKNPQSYAIMLSNHVVRLANARAYSQAKSYAEETHAAFEKANITSTLPYAKFLVNCGVIYSACEEYVEAEGHLVKADSLLGGIVAPDHPDLVRCLSELLAIYDKKGDRANVDKYEQRLRGLVSRTDNSNKRTADLTEKLANTMASKGNYTQAIIIQQSAIDTYRSLDKPNEQAYAMKKLADFYLLADSFQVAVDTARSALTLLTDAKNVRRNDILNTLSMAYYNMDKSDSARIYADQAVRLYREMGDTMTTAYSKTLSNLALYNYVCADTAKAIQTATEALKVQIAQIGADNPDNVSSYYNMSHFYMGINNDSAYKYYHRALELQTSVVRNNFSYLTSAEREVFWNTKSYVHKAAPTLAYLNPTDGSIIGDVYNAQLFTKGLLLNSEINFVNLLKSEGDSLLLAKYERFELLRRDIDAAYATNTPDRVERIKALNAEAVSLERQLVRECHQFGDFMSKLNADYTNIAQSLNDDEAAVELMNIYINGVGDTYLALYLRKGWETPRLCKLFNQAQMDNIGWTAERLSGILQKPREIDSLYRDQEFGKLVWKPLTDNLQGVKTMYFAPAGIFHQLGAEYLSVDSTHVLADLMTCYRVSSTSLIAEQKKDATLYDKASVFGGFDYDMSEMDILAEYENIKFEEFLDEVDYEEEDDFYALALASDSIAFRDLAMLNRVTYLPGTRVEANVIGEQLMSHNVNTDMFVGHQGLESQFKSLSGQHNDIIHIATHGFALSEADLYNKSSFSLMLNEDVKTNPLSRSGLIFAGANYTLSGGTLPSHLDNGILTAREISLLDLSGADLVVLSACRTGMGEVRDDGVFGLQRGFKKAGANTLMMSLWSVNDYATERLMTLFYSNIMNGMGKHAALSEAQRVMRNTPGLDRPSLWAAFIMLDDVR